MQKRTRKQILTLLSVLFLSFSMVITFVSVSADEESKNQEEEVVEVIPEDAKEITINKDIQKIVLEKKWTDSDGEDIDWPLDVETTLHIYKEENPNLEKVEDTYTFNADATTITIEEISLEEETLIHVKEDDVNVDDFDSYMIEEVEEDTLYLTFISEERNLKIEKFINDDVHAELDMADEDVKFSLVAYISEVTSITIQDQLPEGFAFTEDDVEVKVLSEAIDYEEMNLEGEEIEECEIEKEEDLLTVKIEDTEKYLDKYIVVTYTAKNTEVYANKEEYEKAQKDNWDTIDDTKTRYEQEHTGFTSQATLLAIDTDEEEVKKESNVVTVAYSIHALEVEAIFTDEEGEIDWPSDASIKVSLLKITDGEGEIVYQAKEKTLDADNPTCEFEGLLHYSNITYSISESEVKNISDDFIRAIITNDAEMKVTITNEKQTPKISLKVNQEENASGLYQDTFTYSINAYITKDAQSFSITQDIPTDLIVEDIVSIHLKDLDVDNRDAGLAIENAEVNLQDNVLVVSVDDASALQGHYVQFDYVVKANENKTETYTTSATYSINTINDVVREATSEEVSISIEEVIVEEEEVVEEVEVEDNPTLVYETVNLVVNGTWNDNNNEYGHRPKALVLDLVRVDENGIKEVIEEKTISTTEEKWSYAGFQNLPTYLSGKKITYEIQEPNMDFYLTKVENTKDTIEIENISRPWFTTTPNNDAELGEVSILQNVSEGVKESKEAPVSVRLTFNPNTPQATEVIHHQTLTTGEEIILDYVEEGTVVEVKEMDAPEGKVSYVVNDNQTGSAKVTVEKDKVSTIEIMHSKAPKTADNNEAIDYGRMFFVSLIVCALALHVIRNTEVEA